MPIEMSDDEREQAVREFVDAGHRVLRPYNVSAILRQLDAERAKLAAALALHRDFHFCDEGRLYERGQTCPTARALGATDA